MVSANWGSWWGNWEKGQHNLCFSVWQVKDKAKHCLMPWRAASEHELRVTHQLCCAASCPSTGAVQHWPRGWLFTGDHYRPLLCGQNFEMKRKKGAGVAWNSSFFHSRMQVSHSVLTSDQTKKRTSLFVYVSLTHFEELIYRSLSLTLKIYCTEMAVSSLGKPVFFSCIPSLSLSLWGLFTLHSSFEVLGQATCWSYLSAVWMLKSS